MSLVVRSPILTRKLIELLGVDPGIAVGDRELLDTIQLTLDTGVLLRNGVIGNEAGDISGGAWVDYYEVEPGQSWILKWIWKEGTTAATEIAIVSQQGTRITIIPTGNSEVSLDLGDKLIHEGWKLQAFGTSDGGDANRIVRLWYDEEAR